jgi:hypothetical protein
MPTEFSQNVEVLQYRFRRWSFFGKRMEDFFIPLPIRLPDPCFL